jgi:hypothetical protein
MNLTNRSRRIIATAAVACAALLVPAVALASSPARSQVPACGNGSDSTLVWLALAPNAASGTTYYPVEFANVGTHACTLYGYPGVSAVTGSGKRIGPAAGRFGATPHVVTLQPNQSAHALLGIVTDGTVRGCHAATGGGLAVYPPGQTVRQVVPDFTFPACTNKVFMHVYPVTPGIGVP